MAMVGGPIAPQVNGYLLWVYVGYLALSAPLVIWVTRALFKNGRTFLMDAFLGNERLADSFNRLLVIGVCLINIGYVTLALKYGQKPANLHEALEVLSTKIGFTFLVLGSTHFVALLGIAAMRRRALLLNQVPSLPSEEQ